MDKNFGLDIELEKSSQDGSEWQFGAASPKALFSIPIKEDRIKALPDGEVQRALEDMMDCATRGPINILEALFSYGVQNRLFSEGNIQWLRDKGYVQNVNSLERVLFSDAFIAIKSGTRRTGNSMKAPIHAIYKNGLIPKVMLRLEPWMKWDDYHNPARITMEMEDLGRAFSKRFAINYEQVSAGSLKQINEHEFLVVAGYAWDVPKRGKYQKTDKQPNHVFVSVHPEYTAFDNYIDSVGNDFIKDLAPDYRFDNTAYRIFISGEDQYVQDGWWSITFLTELIKKIKDLLDTKPATPVVSPIIPVQVEKSVEIPKETESKSLLLYKKAIELCGKDITPKDIVPDEVACAESVCTVIRDSIYRDFPMITSTTELHRFLKRDTRFKSTLDLKPGSIIISPTGSGNGSVRGHVGIIAEDNNIISNNSWTGMWEKNYTVESWVKRWRNVGKMPVLVFEPI